MGAEHLLEGVGCSRSVDHLLLELVCALHFSVPRAPHFLRPWLPTVHVVSLDCFFVQPDWRPGSGYPDQNSPVWKNLPPWSRPPSALLRFFSFVLTPVIPGEECLKMGLKIFEMMEMITRYLLTSVLKTISDRKVDQAGEFEKIFRLGPDLPVLCFDFFLLCWLQ